jgi:hypothetical protein
MVPLIHLYAAVVVSSTSLVSAHISGSLYCDFNITSRLH